MRSERVHGDYYDYSKVEYVRAKKSRNNLSNSWRIHSVLLYWQAGCEKGCKNRSSTWLKLPILSRKQRKFTVIFMITRL